MFIQIGITVDYIKKRKHILGKSFANKMRVTLNYKVNTVITTLNIEKMKKRTVRGSLPYPLKFGIWNINQGQSFVDRLLRKILCHNLKTKLSVSY